MALKIIHLPDADPAEHQRFLSEGELLSRLVHPNIVRIVDFGTVGDHPVEVGGHRFDRETPYIAMEWLQGKDLAQRQQEKPLNLHQALDCARQVAGALGTAHAAGVVHRDVKPSNIFMLSGNADVSVKLVDFGVAIADALTGGSVAGTPAYMAPEQARGEPTLDARCDVYSLGATLFELCAGRPPTREVEDRIAKLCADPALPLIAAALDRQNDSVHSSTSRNRSDRGGRPGW